MAPTDQLRVGRQFGGRGRPGCLLTKAAAYIPPGRTWTSDLVYKYCLGIFLPGAVAGSEGSLRIGYLDDEGHTAVVSGTTALRLIVPTPPAGTHR